MTLCESVVYFMNPRNLTLGQTITAIRTCSIVWHGDDKVLIFHEEPYNGVVIGCEKRGLGKYIRAQQYFNLEPEPASFKVSKYVWLYTAQQDFDAPLVHVDPEDVW